MDLMRVGAGAITGFLVGLTGVRGGALMTPLLLRVFGVKSGKISANPLQHRQDRPRVAALRVPGLRQDVLSRRQSPSVVQ